MKADEFYGRVAEYVLLPPTERHAQMAQLHTEVVEAYIHALQRITAEDAARPVSIGTDPRTLGQVIAHIMEWERFGILGAGDMLAGVQHPRTVTTVKGFVETDGRVLDFAGTDDFNRYQAEKYSSYSWPQLQRMAIDAAQTFHTLFTAPHLLTAERLEQTLPHSKRLPNGTVVHSTMGWCFWIIYLDHEAAEHAVELGLPH